MLVGATLPRLEATDKNVWLETTTLEHGHGGTDFWGFGQALWSPSRDKTGKDIYSLMRKVKRGELVLHLLKGAGGQLVGYSRAAGPFEEIREAPPMPGEWAGRPSYYRIPLADYTQLEPPVSIKVALKEKRDDFQALLEGTGDRLFYCQYKEDLRLTQGKYLTQVPSELYKLLGGLLHDTETGGPERGTGRYWEGGERTYIQTARERNPEVRAAAIERYGRRCMVCDFDFDAFYGPDLSTGYIEVHHLNPLASLEEPTETDIEDVIVICSNCHRVIHRRKGETLDWKYLRRAVSKRRTS